MFDATEVIPEWFKVEKLIPINFYRYTSFVYDRFVFVDCFNNKPEKFPEQVAAFNALKERVLGMDCIEKYGSENDPAEVHPVRWDNKVVVECINEAGEHIFVGWKDFGYSIGKSRGGDGWIKPFPLIERGAVVNAEEVWNKTIEKYAVKK